MSKNGSLEKIIQVWAFSCLLLASLLLSPWTCVVYILNFSKYGCNEEEEEETYFALRIIYVIVHACKVWCGHSSIVFARRIREFCNFELGL